MTTLAIDFSGGFNDAFRNGIALLPKIGYFLLILIIGFFVAKAIEKILIKVLQKVGFDELVERGGVKQALSKSKYDAATILARIVYYFVFLFVLSAAFSVFGANPISNFLQQIIFFLPRLFAAVLIVIVAAAVAAAIKDVLSNTLGGLSYGETLARAVSLFVLAIGVFAALDQVNIAPLITTGIFYAIVALIVAPLIIAFGVGGIEPARESIRNLQSQGKQKAQEVRQQVKSSREDDDQDDEQDEDDDEEPDDEEYAPPRERARPTPAPARPRPRPTPGAPTRRRRPTS